MALRMENHDKERVLAVIKEILDTPRMNSAHIEISLAYDCVPEIKYTIERTL